MIRAFGTSDARTTTYEYTPSGKITSKTLPSGITLLYTYHPLGMVNCLKSSDGSIHHTFKQDRLGRLTDASDEKHHIAIHRCIDAFGNVMQECFLHGLEVQKTFDAFNRLKGHGEVLYEYDPLFLRKVSKLHHGEIQYSHTYTTFDCDGHLLEEELIGNVGCVRIFAPILDIQGNVRRLVDMHTGAVVQRDDFTAFGEEIHHKAFYVDNPWRYAAKRFDPEIGLIYFGKRYYDPESARWLTTDPAGFIDSVNLYQYVLNNPFKYCDPRGDSIGRYLLGLAEIALGGALMITGGVIEIASFGTLTIGVALAESTGIALIGHGLYLTTTQPRDVKNFYSPWKNTNPFEGPVDDQVFIGDVEGNILSVPEGHRLGGSNDGKCIQQKDKNGKSTGLRKDGKGHPPSPVHQDPRSQNPHAHVPGITNSDGTPCLPIY